MAFNRRDQRTFRFTPQAWWSPRFPYNHACSASQKMRSSRAGIGRLPQQAAGFRLWPGGGVALRLHSAKRCSPPSAPLSPPADHRPKPEVRIRGNVMNSPISDWPISDFSITDCKIASHSSCRRDSAMKPCSIVWRRRSLQDTTGRSLKRSRFRSSFEPARRCRGVCF